jgi:hypothetical protein
VAIWGLGVPEREATLKAELLCNLLDEGCGSQEKTAKKQGICPVKPKVTGENQEKTGIKP